ncbi:MAG: hypothetical protein HY293_12825, partial [Planctomycetes bacterium]|nr:hypothetical protein [Planctomycetota bacterium]
LLAFPLFVVVVGVDVRWISRALELRYRRMMGDGVSERATPFQYIEKVFQLPFELGALSADARRGMTRGLLRASVVAEPAVAPSAPGPGPKPPPPPPPEWLKPPKPLSVVNDLKPASLDLFAREVEHMSRVTAGFGGSPRSIKRLTNVYRLIKTGLSRERAIQFTAERGQDSDYKAVLVLLGVATGFPGKAEDVFNSISGNSEGLGFPPTLQLALQRGLGAAVWSGLAVQPDTMQVVGESSLAAVARWSDKVRRYSFPE